jgi:hypothetical protein
LTDQSKLVYGKKFDSLPLNHFLVEEIEQYELQPHQMGSNFNIQDYGDYIDLASGPTEFNLAQVERENNILGLLQSKSIKQGRGRRNPYDQSIQDNK